MPERRYKIKPLVWYPQDGPVSAEFVASPMPNEEYVLFVGADNNWAFNTNAGREPECGFRSVDAAKLAAESDWHKRLTQALEEVDEQIIHVCRGDPEPYDPTPPAPSQTAKEIDIEKTALIVGEQAREIDSLRARIRALESHPARL